MPNRPDYLACWLGISSVGGTVALINTRLVGRSLAHCIDVARADHVILVGGVVAPCSMLHAGGSVVIAEKFSATSFWDDIVRFDCTVFQYIGELCRYLLKAPTSGLDTGHRLRLAVGNGLRGDIWEAFAARFAIPRILEFYAATEGNFSLFNVEGKPGAIGRVPRLLAHRLPAAIVKVDADSGSPVRDEDGLCIACAHGEVGEAVGRIGAADRGGSPFEGYTDPAETANKILHDVFAEGDAWFRSGDLMMRDEQGYFHFVDRVGDTFRWKGENVATGEVNDAIRDCPGVLDASTYGVAVPGADGRRRIAGRSALRRLPEAGDVASMVEYPWRRRPQHHRHCSDC